MKRSNRELSINTAIDKSLKITKVRSLCFRFIPKTGVGLPKSGTFFNRVLFQRK